MLGANRLQLLSLVQTSLVYPYWSLFVATVTRRRYDGNIVSGAKTRKNEILAYPGGKHEICPVTGRFCLEPNDIKLRVNRHDRI